MKDAVISVRDFRKVYGDVVAVDNINFEVARGEIFGLLGPNGVGKTTTLESLEGLRRPDGGALQVAGFDPSRQARALQDIIGVQLQDSGLPENLSVNDAMKLFCVYHGISPRVDLLDRLGLGSKGSVPIHQLSAGLKRRLALGLAVAHNPQILFLDEPTAGLDVGSRSELHSLLRELQASGATIILATHDMAEAEAMADRVAILLAGKIAAIGTPMELTATGSQLTKISVRTQGCSLSAPDLALPAVQQQMHKEAYTVFFSQDISPTLSAIIAHIETQKDSLIDLRVERPSLEERFLEITHNGGAQ